MRDRSLNEILATLLADPPSIGDESREERLWTLALEATMRLTGFPMGAVYCTSAESRPAIKVNRGVDPAYAEFVVQQLARLPGTKAVLTANLRVCPDVLVDPGYAALREPMQAAGIRANVILPCPDPGREAWDGIVLYHSQPGAPDPAEIADAQTVARAAGLAVNYERIRLARGALVRQAMLEKSQEVVGALTAGIAHDFNNLLGGVLGFVGLAPSLSPSELRNLCDRLKDQVEKAAHLTRSLLGVARTPPSDQQPQLCELSAAVQDAVALVRPSIRNDTVIEVEVPPNELWAMISPMAFSRILLNLLINAVQALHETPGGRITVRATGTPAHCRIEVDDNGPGVHADHTDRIFQPFVSINKAGTGIGLAAARALAESAGGSVSLELRPGPGARFVVNLLPPGTAPLEPGAHAELAPAPSVSVQTGPEILVAVDEALQRRAFAEALRLAGFRVDELAEGLAVLETVRTHNYAALVLDPTLPGMTGVAILGELRARKDRTPVVMVAGYWRDARVDGVSVCERVRTVSKPVSGPQLVRAVQELLDDCGPAEATVDRGPGA